MCVQTSVSISLSSFAELTKFIICHGSNYQHLELVLESSNQINISVGLSLFFPVLLPQTAPVAFIATLHLLMTFRKSTTL
jgi:hypothetical protein